MTLESLSDYFKRADKQSSVNLIYLAYSLERIISEQFGQPVKVVIRKSRVVVYADSQAAATLLTLQLEKLRRCLIDIAPRQLATTKVIIRVRPLPN